MPSVESRKVVLNVLRSRVETCLEKGGCVTCWCRPGQGSLVRLAMPSLRCDTTYALRLECCCWRGLPRDSSTRGLWTARCGFVRCEAAYLNDDRDGAETCERIQSDSASPSGCVAHKMAVFNFCSRTALLLVLPHCPVPGPQKILNVLLRRRRQSSLKYGQGAQGLQPSVHGEAPRF